MRSGASTARSGGTLRSGASCVCASSNPRRSRRTPSSTRSRRTGRSTPSSRTRPSRAASRWTRSRASPSSRGTRRAAARSTRSIARAPTLQGRIPLEHSLLIAEKIATALDHAYNTTIEGERTLHGLVWPGFVSLSDDGETCLTGFGLAPGLLAVARAGRGSRKEIAPYLAPEERRRGKDRQELRRLFRRRHPLRAADRAACPRAGGPVADLFAVARGPSPLPPEVTAVLKMCLSDAASRYQSSGELRRELGKLLFSGPYSPSTFNLAYFLNNVFAPEIEAETRAREKEAALDPAAVREAPGRGRRRRRPRASRRRPPRPKPAGPAAAARRRRPRRSSSRAPAHREERPGAAIGGGLLAAAARQARGSSSRSGPRPLRPFRRRRPRPCRRPPRRRSPGLSTAAMSAVAVQGRGVAARRRGNEEARRRGAAAEGRGRGGAPRRRSPRPRPPSPPFHRRPCPTAVVVAQAPEPTRPPPPTATPVPVNETAPAIRKSRQTRLSVPSRFRPTSAGSSSSGCSSPRRASRFRSRCATPGRAGLTEAAIAAVKRWTFSPGRVHRRRQPALQAWLGPCRWPVRAPDSDQDLLLLCTRST